MTSVMDGVPAGIFMSEYGPGEMYTQPPLPVAEYVDYRVLCDYETNAFRHIGVQDPEAYRSAVADSRTVFVPIDGRLYPAAVPVGHEKMYASDRCRELTGKNEVLLLSLPLERVRDGQLAGENLVGGEGLSEDFAIIVEQHRPDGQEYDRDRDHESIAAQMRGFGELHPGEFVHELLLTKPEHRTAWMSMYEFSIKPIGADPERLAGLSADERLDHVWAEYKEERGLPSIPTEHSNETYLFTAKELRENPNIVEALWKIAEKGFGKILGAYHPVSMEFNREFFEGQILTDGIYTAVRYHEGKPVCFGSMAQNMDHNDWLDHTSTVLRDQSRDAVEKQQLMVHFFELISDSQTGLSFSPDVLKLYLELEGRAGQSCKVVFESTNLSSRYIPKIVQRQVDVSPYVMMDEPIRRIATLDYWYLTKDTTVTS